MSAPGKKVEGLVIVGAFIAACAVMADFLPAEMSVKITGGLMTLWMMLRFLLRATGKSEQVKEIEDLRTEVEGWKKVMQSKRAEPVKNEDSRPSH